jgi:MFS family permease
VSGLAFAAALTLPNPWWGFGAVFLGSATGSIASPIIAAAVQNESPAALRATAAAFGTLAVSLTGIGLAPLLIGLLSDALTPTYGQHALRYALLIGLSACVVTAALHWKVGRLLKSAGAAAGA